MRRASLALIAGGALLLLLGLLLTLFAGATSMPSYLANWLFWASLPLGALPVVMALDLAGPGAGFGMEGALRRLLLLMPLAAILLIPVVMRPAALFGWANGHGFTTPIGQAWMSDAAFVIRNVVYGLLLIVLMLIFVRAPAPAAVPRRRGLAALGLVVYLPLMTFASVDWAMTVEPDWFSAGFGLLLMSAQAVVAVCAASLLAGPAWRRLAPEPAAAFLIVAAAAWAFMQFIQFLVIWSANKPSDISWYLHRSNPGSLIAVGLGFIAGFLMPLLVLQSPELRRRARVLPAMAVLMLIVQALDMLWLITPSIRHDFTISGMDVLELAGIGGVMMGLCLLLPPPVAAPLASGTTGHPVHG